MKAPTAWAAVNSKRLLLWLLWLLRLLWWWHVSLPTPLLTARTVAAKCTSVMTVRVMADRGPLLVRRWLVLVVAYVLACIAAVA